MGNRAPRILIVDDDFAMQELFGLLLSAAGFQVLAAESTEAAEAEVQRAIPDLMLVDLHLSRADGLELVKKLLPQTGGTMPVIAISASTGTEVRERVLAAGCLELLAKPIDPATFASQVERFVRRPVTSRRPNPVPRYNLSESEGRQMRSEFVRAALHAIEQLSARSDDKFFSDALLADAAHRWAGASGIGGLPNVAREARELELLAEAQRVDRLPEIRRSLELLRQQFAASESS